MTNIISFKQPAAKSAGKNYRDVTVQIDGGTFNGCTFTKCLLKYDGGNGTIFTSNTLIECNWSFGGGASFALAILASIAGNDMATIKQHVDAALAANCKQ